MKKGSPTQRKILLSHATPSIPSWGKFHLWVGGNPEWYKTHVKPSTFIYNDRQGGPSFGKNSNFKAIDRFISVCECANSTKLWSFLSTSSAVTEVAKSMINHEWRSQTNYKSLLVVSSTWYVTHNKNNFINNNLFLQESRKNGVPLCTHCLHSKCT